MSPTRDECLQAAAQHTVDAHARLFDLVRRTGPEEAAALVWHPGHPLTQEQIAERLARLTTTRGAA